MPHHLTVKEFKRLRPGERLGTIDGRDRRCTVTGIGWDSHCFVRVRFDDGEAAVLRAFHARILRALAPKPRRKEM